MGEGGISDDVFAAATDNGPVSDVDITLIEEDYSPHKEQEELGYTYNYGDQRQAFLEKLRDFLDGKEVYSIDIQTPTNDDGLTRYEAWIVYGENDG